MRSTPTRLGKDAFGGLAAVMVACGMYHMMVVTADGRLWTFGCGDSGQLGHVDTEHKLPLSLLVPTLVWSVRVGEAKIVMAAAGGHHSMAAGICIHMCAYATWCEYVYAWQCLHLGLWTGGLPWPEQ